MRYIQKLEIPTFFTKTIKDFKIWKDFKDKKQTKKYILENEQNYLCCYCECLLEFTPQGNNIHCHLEHIKPKNKFPELIFDYNNLIVSCQGNIHSGCFKQNTCGHRKDNEYDENLFLNPTKIKNINSHFSYNTENGKICSETPQGKYMIFILNLNDDLNNLKKARKNALESFEEIAMNLEKDDIKELLLDDTIPFISILRFEYKNIL